MERLPRWLDVVDGVIVTAAVVYIILALSTDILFSEYIILPFFVWMTVMRGIWLQKNGKKFTACMSFIASSFFFIMFIYLLFR